MKHLRQFVVAAIISVTATSLASTLPASATTHPPSADTVSCYNQESIESAQDLDWVSAELGYTGNDYAMLRARATTIGPWEQFSLCYDSTAAYWYIISDANGMYVSAEFGYTGNDYAMLRARSTSIGPWEKFTLTCHVLPIGPQWSYLTIQSQVNGNYVSAQLGYTGSDYAMLRASAQSVTPTEEFTTHTARIGC
jgi:hypothetical protein